MSQHAIVSIDHHAAKIFHLDGSDANLALKEATARETDNRHKNDGKRPDHKHLFDDVAKGLAGAKEIIIVGNGPAKEEFKHHLDAHHKSVAAHVVAVEAIDHPTTPQLIALAKKRFKTIDAFLGDKR